MNIRIVSLSSVNTAYPVTVIAGFEEDKNLAKHLEIFGPEAKEWIQRLNQERVFLGKKGELYVSLLSKSKMTKNILFLGLGSKKKIE